MKQRAWWVVVLWVSLAPSVVAQEWDDRWFAYEAPVKLAVEERTPERTEVNVYIPPMKRTDRVVRPTTRPAEPYTIAGMDVTGIRLRNTEGQVVPALLCKPTGEPGPFPLVIAGHGLWGHKSQIAMMLGPAMTRRGFALLAPDLPHHGERPGTPLELMRSRDPDLASRLLRRAVIDIRQLIDWAETREDLDLSEGIIFSGYSMGCWIGSVAAAADSRIKSLVLMVGGSRDGRGVEGVARLVVDPGQALARFRGTLLMMCGRRDRTVTPEMSRRLFQSARHPKRIIWFDSGHLLPESAFDEAADWAAERIRPRAPGSDFRRASSRAPEEASHAERPER